MLQANPLLQTIIRTATYFSDPFHNHTQQNSKDTCCKGPHHQLLRDPDLTQEYIEKVLIPMVEDYGSDQLQIIGIDTSQPDGGQLYQAGYKLRERRGVVLRVFQ